MKKKFKKVCDIIIMIFAALTIACGVDVTDPQAGYFDDHQDKSGTQTFNNNGSGTMEVNINYNNQSVQPSIVQTEQPSIQKEQSAIQLEQPSLMNESPTTSVLLAGIQFEYIGNSLYGTNLNDVEVSCEIAYRSDAPRTGRLSVVKPHMNGRINVPGTWTACLTVTYVSCKSTNKEISSWLGDQVICKS